MMPRWLIFGVARICLLTAFPVDGAELTLARDGEPHARIVVGEDVSPAARFAAKELQRYVEKATGAVLPIVDHLGEDGQIELVIGAGQIALGLGVSVEGLRRTAASISRSIGPATGVFVARGDLLTNA